MFNFINKIIKTIYFCNFVSLSLHPAVDGLNNMESLVRFIVSSAPKGNVSSWFSAWLGAKESF